MKIKLTLGALAMLALLSTLNPQLSTAHAQGTGFTYDGLLQKNSTPQSGTFNFTFSLYDVATGGAPIAGPFTTNGVPVKAGAFTVTMDFGAGVWNGQTNWLEIGVEANGDVSFTPLTPRQQIMPTPYAIFAETASNLSGTLSVAQLNGPVPNSQLANSSITVNAGTGLSGGGTVALGGATMLNNAGVTSLSGGGGVTVSASSGGVTLGSTATSANTPNAMVSRDGTGSFSAESLTLAGLLNLAAPPVTINSGAASLLLGDVNNNLFIGLAAGNSTTGGHNNTATGNGALASNTIGDDNTANGAGALALNADGRGNTATGAHAMANNTGFDFNTADGYGAMANSIGSGNTAVGANSLSDNSGIDNAALGLATLASNSGDHNTAVGTLSMTANTFGSDNTTIGFESLTANSSGNYNTADGSAALQSNTTGSENTASGYAALLFNALGNQNTALGNLALEYPTDGNRNVAIGYKALWQLGANNGSPVTGGTNNIALGFMSGANFIGNESSNIDIGNMGVLGENNVIRIGDQQTVAYIAGVITGNGSGLTSLNASQLTSGAINNSQLANSSITINPGTGLSQGGTVALGGSITLNNAGVTSLTGGDGVTVSAATGDLTLGLGSTLTLPNLPVAIVAGNGSLLYADNNQNFFTGPGAGNPATTGIGNTAGGNGALANNSTGYENTAYGASALFGNGGGYENTAVGYNAMQGNNGNENTAYGANTLVGNLGNDNTAEGSGALSHNTANGNTANGAHALAINASGFYNTAEGFQALGANMNGSSNVANGMGALLANRDGSYNTANGVNALGGNENGSFNVADGSGALAANGGGSYNTAVGYSALNQLGGGNFIRGGTNNIALGFASGSAFKGLESSNIDIGNIGVLGENNITRIGTPGIQTAAYIAGVITGNGSGLTSLNASQLTSGTINNSQLANSSITINTGSGITGGTTVSLGGSVTLGLGSTITLAGNLPFGINTQFGSIFHVDFNDNYFAGIAAGNMTTSGGAANTATGNTALENNTSGSGNSAFGYEALLSNTGGNWNTAAGSQALFANTSGTLNIAVGMESLNNNTTGSSNIAIGYFAGSAISTRSDNIDIGNTGSAADDGIIRIGTPGTQTATYLAGICNTEGYGCLQGTSGASYGHTFNFWWTGSQLQAWVDTTDVGVVSLTSDRRLKENIQPMADDALTQVMALKPSSFKYKNIPGTIFQGDGTKEEGFIADELQQIIPSAVNGQKDATTSKGTIQPQTVNLMPLVAVLTKAVQEQQQEINDLKAEIKTLSEHK